MLRARLFGADPRANERGQSFVETAIALPAMLIALTFLFWSMKFGVLTERVETMARYSNVMLPARTQYGRYSMLSVYSAALDKPVANLACLTPPTNWLGENGVAQVNGVTFPRGKLWSSPVINGWCRSGYVGFTDSLFTRDYVIGFTRSGGSAQFTPPIFGSVYRSDAASTVASRSGNMFDAASSGTVVTCFPELLHALRASMLTGAAPSTDPTIPFVSDATHYDDPPPELPLKSDITCRNEVVTSSK